MPTMPESSGVAWTAAGTATAPAIEGGCTDPEAAEAAGIDANADRTPRAIERRRSMGLTKMVARSATAWGSPGSAGAPVALTRWS
jgi:hypothetical protein